MKSKTKNTKKLGNPALLIAGSEAGQKAISNASDNQKAVVQATASVIPFLIKTIVIVGGGLYLYYRFTNRFISLKENPNYPVSNITNNQAQTKAESIYNAMLGFGNGFEIVKTNIAGLNYNAFIKVYNAFGNRQGSIPFSDKMNMVEWFTDQFDESELNQLRFLVPNMF
ncbi:hypothetical protein [Flavobacterium sp.]|uniref:hypothetical protein n=3 Tax=Flavobacterium sp. TaxID=239 RepID=UPI004047D30A